MRHTIAAHELAFIDRAANYLERPSLLIAIADKLGKPVEWLVKGVDTVSPISVADLIDAMLQGVMNAASVTVSRRALDLDFRTGHARSVMNGRWHAATTAVTGGAGGVFGLPALAVELPITTGVMFRSIACTARNFGKDLEAPEVFLDCISVFSYGGSTGSDDAVDSAYLSLRASIATEMRLAARFLAKHTGDSFAQQIAKGQCPKVLAFLARVAAEFNVALSRKVAAFLVPGISIASGAVVNAAFTAHFNSIAVYHFGLQRLAAAYGEDAVFGEYRAAAERIRRGVPARKPRLRIFT